MKPSLVGCLSQSHCRSFHPPARQQSEAENADVRLGQNAESVVRCEKERAVRGKNTERLVAHSSTVAHMFDHGVGYDRLECLGAKRQRFGVRADQGDLRRFRLCFVQALPADEKPAERNIDTDNFRELV